MQSSSRTRNTPEAPPLPWIVLRLGNRVDASEGAAFPEIRIHANSSGFRELAQVFEKFAAQCDLQDAAPNPHGASTTTSITIEPGVPTSTAGPAIREVLSDQLGLRLLHLPNHERDLWIQTWCAGLGDHRSLTLQYPELVARAQAELRMFELTVEEDGDWLRQLDPWLLSPDEALRRLALAVPHECPLYGLEVLRRHDGGLQLDRSHAFGEGDEPNPWTQAIALLQAIREHDVVVAFVPLRSTPHPDGEA